jgi:hypothetical protein
VFINTTGCRVSLWFPQYRIWNFCLCAAVTFTGMRTAARRHASNQYFSNCDPRRSVGGFERKSISKIVSNTNTTPIHFCTKTAFVGWQTESRRITSFHNFLSFNRCFRKYFKLVYRTDVVMITSVTDIVFLLFTCKHFWVWIILRGVPRVGRQPMKWSVIAWSLRNTAIKEIHFWMLTARVHWSLLVADGYQHFKTNLLL